MNSEAYLHAIRHGGETSASGAPNDFSRSLRTPNAPTHYSEEPKNDQRANNAN